jgi:hypothetical protein
MARALAEDTMQSSRCAGGDRLSAATGSKEASRSQGGSQVSISSELYEKFPIGSAVSLKENRNGARGRVVALKNSGVFVKWPDCADRRFHKPEELLRA